MSGWSVGPMDPTWWSPSKRRSLCKFTVRTIQFEIDIWIYGHLLFTRIVKPLKVKIVSPNDLLLAGKSMPITCEAWGSFPPAKVTWLLDGEPIRNTDITVHTDNSDVSTYIYAIHI